MRQLLIANRGEIACRIQRSARQLGWRTIALYTAEDAQALHVEQADQACLIDSYLNIDSIIEVARACAATALHPGYGFLSERPELARACAEAGLIFIGPPAPAIASMGSKAEAKILMAQAQVPLIPGYHDPRQDLDSLSRAAQQIGFPLMIKASSGGGGKGMRRVDRLEDLAEALQMARREALAAFGDDRLLLEKLITPARHIEVQVLADQQGQVIYLLDRDCSWQRRHQKVLEEAPAPGLPESLRQAMGEAACRAARAVHYCGAGTLEFLVDEDFNFYFMEMNTRLQVEHPITEAILGIDLVGWQLRIALGEALDIRQEDVRAQGHAFEARLYAEDPQRNFMPSSGRLQHLRWPEGLRIDAGYRCGDRMSSSYDPMIGKLIAHAPDREQARSQLMNGLARLQLDGLQHNAGFLYRLLDSEACRSGLQHTALLESLPALRDVPQHLQGLPVPVAALLLQQLSATTVTQHPWQQLRHFRVHGGALIHRRLLCAGAAIEVELRHQGGLRWSWRQADQQGELQARADAGGLWVQIGRSSQVLAGRVDGDDVYLYSDGECLHCQVLKRAPRSADGDAQEHCRAPMHGRIVQVLVAAGDQVLRGQTLLHMEAMKMEQRILAPAQAVVAQVLVHPGQQVESGQILLHWQEASADTGEA